MIDCFRKPTNAVVISHEQNATMRLMAAVHYFIKNMDDKPFTSIENKKELRFPKTNSYYFIGTAGQRAFGRGDTVHRAHLSEAAYYDHLKEILGGISEAAEYGQIDIETTPNGRGEFYDMWQKAKTGKSPYTPVFIPWFIDDEYSVDSLTQDERDGLSDGIREMFNMPDQDFYDSLDKKEQNLIRRVRKEYGTRLTVGQMKWRRYKIWDKDDLFYQEYPEDDVSCFLQAGRAAFKHIKTDITKRIPLDNIQQWGDDEKREALRKRVLYSAIDGAEGTEGGDNHCFSVIDPGDLSKDKSHVVFEYTSNEPIDVFWTKIYPVLKNFRIMLGIEKNGVGLAHIEKAKALGIRYVPYHTGTNRPIMITDLEESYRKELLIETYPEAENEARDMIYNKANKAEAPTGKHDDRILSRAIALQMKKKPIPRVSSL